MPLDSSSLKARSIGPLARQIRALFDQILGTPTAANVNYLTLTGAAASAEPAIVAAGADADLDVILTPKGTGTVRFGTFTGGADTVSNGYIMIKDAGGTNRKVMITA